MKSYIVLKRNEKNIINMIIIRYSGFNTDVLKASWRRNACQIPKNICWGGYKDNYEVSQCFCFFFFEKKKERNM